MTKYLIKLFILSVFGAGSMQAPDSLAATQEKPSKEFRMKLAKAIANAPDSFKDKFDAEVWLVEQSIRLAKAAPHIPEDERLTILRHVHQEATNFNLDPMLVLAVIDVESDFDQYAISSAGARGLMQVMPFWKDVIGKQQDSLFNIETNLRYGCAILSLYLEKEKSDTTRALARYNGSRGQTWYPMRVYKSMRRIWHP
ncbi:lytic transglycosylase domain-containing protein [Aliikangiella marina]|uniref:Lytic transglycosylase domain-containing protein n=1 Tax=Aliikangiella marina TaxID=1712262 RepID=A0A545TH02_9GAMM|nr:transglycosylase SLT domain-containing protein [Aliikangiella marina]TQV76485.1 lytic transglycosylase domain-containing protein [Aliikangiella marina]